MKAIRRLIGQEKKPTTFDTQERSIPAVPADEIGQELKSWANSVGVVLAPVDAVWWQLQNKQDLTVEERVKSGVVGLQFHGGGYMLGRRRRPSRGSLVRIPRGLIQHGICASVLSVEYSLIGLSEDDESRPFPTQLLEAVSAYRYLLKDMNVPASRIVFVGDSAGAHLVLALQRYLCETQTLPFPSGLFLHSPWCDLSADAQRPQMPRLLGSMTADHLSSPYFSPSLNPAPRHWPPTLIYYGETEQFKTSIVALESQLKNANAKVTAYAAPGIPEYCSHDFLIMANVENGFPEEVRKCWRRVKGWAQTLEAKR
ncbi:alpha/beta-hydrolase [Epithele typhae]|uniref:alpha/beta-hydrolase n=1 Tax=Epithele typhae TaxID=378194 RepID=UPI002007F0B4|nr:alpha/beta-hydrolase [Epithele typhae]KAH9932132.1 alpha/beta-hydrolase [Epithele typhae]